MSLTVCGNLHVNFHSVTIKDTLSNVIFLTKVDFTPPVSYEICLNCFTVKALYFVNIIICTNAVNGHAVTTCMLDKNACIYNPGMLF